MNVSAVVLRTHLDYTNWATNRLLKQAAELTPERLNRDFGTAHKNVLQTLGHIHAADNLWLARLEGSAAPASLGAMPLSFEDLQEKWPALQQRWVAYGSAITDESADGLINYYSLAGQAFTQPLWQLLLHIVNHATHHRGQASGFLRALGRTPDPLDLVAYYRQLGAWNS